MKKLPPGVIRLENVILYLLFIIIIFIILLVFMYIHFSTKNIKNNNHNHITIENKRETGDTTGWFGGFLPSWPYTKLPKDVLLNPYAAPYSDERYFVPEVTYVSPSAVPINISTNIGAVDTSYRQMGIITPLNGTSKDNILPLMGRPLFTNRDKWQYYAISNQHNNVKLPILFNGRSGLNDNGVNQIYNKDTIYVEGYNEPFRVTIYENDTIKYLPFV